MSEPDLAHLAKLKLLLHHDGIRSAMAYLNSLTAHRFTALYRLDAQTARALYFFDRKHPWVETTPDHPVNQTYCVVVLERRRPLVIDDAESEPWLAEHPARRAVRSYCGVPVAPAGAPYGALCHYDVLPRATDDVTVGLLQAFAGLLCARLPATG